MMRNSWGMARNLMAPVCPHMRAGAVASSCKRHSLIHEVPASPPVPLESEGLRVTGAQGKSYWGGATSAVMRVGDRNLASTPS